MPRNRPHLDRDDKVAEIVDAARQRLVDGGHDALSVAGIARDLGLAQAAIYWYFPTKDHLFVAALERIFHDLLNRKPRGATRLDQLLWFTDRLSEIGELRMALRDRARVAPVAARFERDVTAFLRVMFVNSLGGDANDDAETVADTLMALCEGVLVQDLSRNRRRALIRFAYARLVPDDGCAG